MILSARDEFCNSTTFTATVANAIIGNVMDLGATPTTRDLGVNEPMWLVLQVDTAFTSNGSATCTFTLLSDSTADLATSATTHITTPAYPVASLTAGAQFAFRLPSGDYERYLGLFGETKVQTLNTGKVSAFLTHDLNAWKALPGAW